MRELYKSNLIKHEPHKPCNKLPYDWNETDVIYPDQQTIYQLFKEQAEKTPHAEAVLHNTVIMTYTELLAHVHKLVYVLYEAGVEYGSIVVLAQDRGIDYLSSMLAVWALGGAFVPLNPDLPIDKNNTVVKQTGHVLILTSEGYQNYVKTLEQSAQIVCVERAKIPRDLVFDYPVVSSNALAYIMFTSGSTGVPKGAMVQHDGAVNHLFAKIRDFDISSKDTLGQTVLV
jgi:non-ribosomal peptide synthetase component F